MRHTLRFMPAGIPRGANRPGRFGLPGNCRNPGHPGTGLRRGQRNIARMARVPGNPAVFQPAGREKLRRGRFQCAGNRENTGVGSGRLFHVKQSCCGPRRVGLRENLSTSGGAPRGGRLFQTAPDNGRVPAVPGPGNFRCPLHSHGHYQPDGVFVPGFPQHANPIVSLKMHFNLVCFHCLGRFNQVIQVVTRCQRFS